MTDEGRSPHRLEPRRFVTIGAMLRGHFDPAWIVLLMTLVSALTFLPLAPLTSALVETTFRANPDFYNGFIHHYDLRATGFVPGNRPATLLPAASGYSTPLRSLSDAPAAYLTWISLASQDSRLASCYLFDDGSIGRELSGVFLSRRAGGWPNPYYPVSDHPRLSFMCSVLWQDASEPVVDELFRRDRQFLAYSLAVALSITVALILLPWAPQPRAAPSLLVAGVESAIQLSAIVLKTLTVVGLLYLLLRSFTIPTGPFETVYGAGSFLGTAQLVMQLRTISSLALLSTAVVLIYRYRRLYLSGAGRQSASAV